MCKRLIIMSGVPGSGKSTYAKELQHQYGDRVRIASSDDIRYELFGTYDYFKGDPLMWKELEKRIIDWSTLPHPIVVLDACCLTNKVRRKWLRKFRPYFDFIELVIVETPFFECVKRQELRERKVPSEVIHNMYCAKEQPEEEDYASFDKITERRL